MKTMNAVNAVQLFILVWTFTAVHQADGDISVSCEDVTGTVSEEVTFTCSVSQKSGCCIKLYKFLYPEKYNDPTICREEFPRDPCEQRNSFTCSFSSITVLTGPFRFFIQTNCGWKKTEFTVNITEPEKGITGKMANLVTTESPGDKDLESKTTVIAAVTGCFIIIIIMAILYKKKPNYSKPCGFQTRIFLGHKHDDNNSNIQEHNPDNVIKYH